MSSKRAQRRRSCDGKNAYPDAAAARGNASTMARRTGSRPLNAYQCEFCRSWHLGHPPKRVRQAIAATKAQRRRTA